MAITNEEAIRFTNEQIRPMAEKLRNLYYEAKALQVDWFNGMSVLIPNSVDEILMDERTDVSELSGADISNIITQLSTIITQFEGVGVLNVIQKPCVRPLEVN